MFEVSHQLVVLSERTECDPIPAMASDILRDYVGRVLMSSV